MRLSLVITILFAVAACCTPVCAEPISLAYLIDNYGSPEGSILVGDKLFDNFSYDTTGEDMPSASNVNISSWEDAAGNFGIQIQGAFLDLYDEDASDAVLGYRVTATDPNKLISDAHIQGNPSSWAGTALGDAIIEVVEIFSPEAPNSQIQIVAISDKNGSQAQLFEDVYFDTPQRSLTVTKDILAYAKDPYTKASISVIYQSFSQVEVPEPTGVVFLLSGLVLLCCRVRRSGR